MPLNNFIEKYNMTYDFICGVISQLCSLALLNLNGGLTSLSKK